MAPKKKAYRPAPKVFHCSGHGDCRMVFTRSEHLARHIRKHTGEKPFKCVVPGCSRMFTRFDNMMQHTRTHGRHKKKTSSSVCSAPAPAAECAGVGAGAGASATSSPTPVVSSMPTHTVTPPTTSTGHPAPYHDDGSASMLQSRTLPMPPIPPKIQWGHRRSYHAFVSPPTTFSPLPQPWHQQQHQHQQQYYPYQEDHTAGTTPMLSPTWSSTLPLHDLDIHTPKRMSMPTNDSEDKRFSLTTSEFKKGRRLSMIDLQTPIGYWSEHTADEDSDASSTVEVTSDEYEAILGFGRFHTEPPRKPMLATVAIDNPDLQIHPLCPVQGSFQQSTIV